MASSWPLRVLFMFPSWPSPVSDVVLGCHFGQVEFRGPKVAKSDNFLNTELYKTSSQYFQEIWARRSVPFWSHRAYNRRRPQWYSHSPTGPPRLSCGTDGPTSVAQRACNGQRELVMGGESLSFLGCHFGQVELRGPKLYKSDIFFKHRMI